MTSNKSFLWSLAQGTPDGKEQDAARTRDSATSTFLWRTSSSAGVQLQASAPAHAGAEALYDDVGGGRQDVYDDAGFEEQQHEGPPEKPTRTWSRDAAAPSSSTRSSATSSGVWSSPEHYWGGGDSGSTLSDEGPRYEEPTQAGRPPELKTAVGDVAAVLAQQLAADGGRMSRRTTTDEKDSPQDDVGTRSTSVKLLAMRFEALSHHDEQFRKAPHAERGRGAEREPPKMALTQRPAGQEEEKVSPTSLDQPARLPDRSPSSSGSRRLPARPPPPLLTVHRRDSFSSSSDSSNYSSPPPSPAPERPPPPPPLSTLPSRNNSQAQDVRPQPPSPKDDSENIYETLRGSIEMGTYANEPLYQIYNQNAEELAREYISREFESSSPGRTPPAASVSARDAGGGSAPRGQFRTLWCQLPEVRNNHILETLTPERRKLMEAKFEIIASEASYISSLNILKNHFMVHLEQCNEADFCKEDRRLLFGDVVPVRKVAEKLMTQMEACRQQDIFMRGILQVIHDVARDDLKIYIDYCAYQNSRTRTMERLITRSTEPAFFGGVVLEEVSYRLSSLWSSGNSRYQQPGIFAQALAALEAHPVCQGLTLQSFLLVPMQRITKLQLLVGAVLNCMDQADEEYDICKMALQQISDVVHECNEGVRSVERMEELLALSKQVKFDRGLKMLPLYSSNRWLVKRGKVTELNPEWFTTKSIYIFIFNDILFLAKKRKLFPQHAERFLVVDYCNREDVRLMNTEGTLHLPDKLRSGFCMLLTLLKNHRQKKVSKLIYFTCESDRQRWTDALNPPELGKPSKEWPQVVVKWPYTAEQPDELSLQVSDIIIVFTKSADGWYQGQRIRDGETGWFPGNYTVDVEPVQLRDHAADNHVVMSIYYV